MRWYLAAGHVPGVGARAGGFEEGAQAVLVTRALARELRRRGAKVTVVPHRLDLGDTIEWVNRRSRSGDRTLELHFNAAGDTQARGAMLAVTNTSREWAPAILAGLRRAGMPTWSGGVYHETEVAGWRGWSHLGFPHQTRPSAVLVELGFVTNDDDRAFWQDAERRREACEQMARALVPKRHRRRRKGVLPGPSPKPKWFWKALQVFLRRRNK